MSNVFFFFHVPRVTRHRCSISSNSAWLGPFIPCGRCKWERDAVEMAADTREWTLNNKTYWQTSSLLLFAEFSKCGSQISICSCCCLRGCGVGTTSVNFLCVTFVLCVPRGNSGSFFIPHDANPPVMTQHNFSYSWIYFGLIRADVNSILRLTWIRILTSNRASHACSIGAVGKAYPWIVCVIEHKEFQV